jgi:hypothetical protein
VTKYIICFKVAKAEEQQHVDLKVTSKKIRAEQEKELKTFREGLKQVSNKFKRLFDTHDSNRENQETLNHFYLKRYRVQCFSTGRSRTLTFGSCIIVLF